ncbi:hypothetical protein F503_06879 [Ophiostoma piceae UAMH 11346]|uniref:Uncharacterized protein n=1 Tax=Ophiostoma piceae (strain UAMH 11346) TaxID=1262450 RepID=S3CR70_OPHP1|nr:hypothetical protein F503_06879 [Ophiostoma piceae UAMH 11346]
MSEEGGFAAPSAAAAGHGADNQDSRRPGLTPILVLPRGSNDILSPTSPIQHTPNPFGSRQHTSLDIDDYFVGPRDISKHSKWPLFMQMHGSILPKMILPLFFLGGWSSCIVCVSKFTDANLGISSTLLTVTGFVVSLTLSFRSSTAYERYAEGRRYWAQLINTSNCLGRVFWVHAKERDDERDRDVLAKLTALKLIVAFAVALKHKLRFEPYTDYPDLDGLVGHLDTCARAATLDDPSHVNGTQNHSFLKRTGEFLGVSFAASNPRKQIKRAKRSLGNLPLEILTYLATFTDDLVLNGQLPVPMQQTLAYNNVATLNDILTGCERVLTTPVPIAYAIAINQITWLYVFLLPFQLFSALGWITIPASMAAGYIILGLLFIGREVENPFGQDVNDLPLDTYCAQIAAEVDLMAARPKPVQGAWIESLDNKVLWPLSTSGWNVWMHRGEARVREALRTKCDKSYTVDEEEEEVTVKKNSRRRRWRRKNGNAKRVEADSANGSITATEHSGKEKGTRSKVATAIDSV